MSPDKTDVFASQLKQGRYLPRLLAGFVLLLTLGLTYIFWGNARELAAQNLQSNFDFNARETIEQIEQHMAAYRQVLRGAKGLLYGSETVTREEFHDYVVALRLEESYPGIQGVAVALVIPKAQKDAHVDAMREQGFSDYDIHPAGERDFYTSITRIEPFTAMNRRAFGYDMYTNPVRREAMAKARDTGSAAMSGKVTLMQEGNADIQAGFLIYLPVYSTSMPPTTVVERRKHFIGWVYAPFRMDDFMHDLRGERGEDLRIRIYDGNETPTQAQLYDSRRGKSNDQTPLLSSVRHMEVVGHPWTVRIDTLPAFEERMQTGRPQLIAITGIGASLLLAFLFWLMATGRMRALAVARKMTRELRASEFIWKYALESSGDGVWDWNVQTGDVMYSKRWKALLGYAEDELANDVLVWQNLVHPLDLPVAEAALKAYFDGEADSYVSEYRMRCKDGRWIWILGRGMVVSRDNEGQPLRMIGTHTDITTRKQGEHSLREILGDLELRVQQRTADLVSSNQQLRLEIQERQKAESELSASRTRMTTIFDAVAEGLVMIDVDFTIIEINSAAKKILSCNTQLAVGEKFGEVLQAVHENGQEFPRALYPFALALETGSTQSNVVMGASRPDGEITWLLVSAVPLLDAAGAVNAVVVSFSDITRKKQSEELIWRQANFDTVTGLPNRRLLLEHLDLEMRKAERTQLPLALLFIDLDRFKDVNDTLGHSVGDILLQEAGQRLKSCVRDTDTVARLGGDEFTIILGELHDLNHVNFIAQEILQRIAEPFALGVEVAYISASIGITLYPNDAREIDTLLINADQAMYTAKNQGRNRYRWFTASMQEAAQTRMWVANELRHALSNNQLSMVYQPIVELTTGLTTKAEALIRWQHPTRGLIPPAEFIPVAEETGLIVSIGEWVFREVAAQLKHWRTDYHPDFQISINKSTVQFHNKGNNYESWLEHLKKAGLPGRSLAVEITEGLLLDASMEVIKQLHEFRGAGIQVSLDDFGTGYSSLAYLKKFDVDTIKIDQSFIMNLAPGSDGMALCEAIIVMAHKLGICVIAEGIETEQQLELLTNAGCDFGQGYLFSQPVPAEVFWHSMPDHATTNASG
jgi:diguanylate cyclase (GGDEF)-like protein/PAS domain S-box-containing protein